jgi:peptide deformylase
MPVLTVENQAHDRKLHKVCKKVKDFGSTEFLIMVQEMKKIASQPGAAGVAASQLGYSLRAFAISTDKNYPPIVIINPVLKGVSEEVKEVIEGCLSAPGKVVKLQRFQKVKIAWQDEHGNSHNKVGQKFEFEFNGFEAQAIQHEMDHLDGVLCIDRADEVFEADQFQKAFEAAQSQSVVEEIELVPNNEIEIS